MSKRKCSIEKCNRPHDARGYCSTHYYRWNNSYEGDLSDPVRTIDPNRGCKVESCEQPHRSKGYCNKHYQTYRSRQRKLELIDGRGCERCGFDKHPAALCFHHPDDADKEFTIGHLLHAKGLNVLQEEANKCELLCANCHQIEHASGEIWTEDL